MFQVIEESKWADRLRRAGAGDMSALSALYDETSVSVFSLILRIVQDRQSAEDILRRALRSSGRRSFGTVSAIRHSTDLSCAEEIKDDD